MPAAKGKIVILIADDDEEDRMFVRKALEDKPADVQFVADGQELLDYLLCRGKYKVAVGLYPRPDLVLLDLNMPKMGGEEALAKIKAHPCLKSIPVIILTTSQERCEVHRCYELGASSYLVKPLTFEQLVEMMHALHLYWSSIARLPAPPIPPGCTGPRQSGENEEFANST